MATEHKTHLFSYRFGDARWSLEIQATSAEEAKERMKAIAWATYDGELVAKIPAVLPRPIFAFIFRLFKWLRSLSKPCWRSHGPDGATTTGKPRQHAEEE